MTFTSLTLLCPEMVVNPFCKDKKKTTFFPHCKYDDNVYEFIQIVVTCIKKWGEKNDDNN